MNSLRWYAEVLNRSDCWQKLFACVNNKEKKSLMFYDHIQWWRIGGCPWLKVPVFTTANNFCQPSDLNETSAVFIIFIFFLVYTTKSWFCSTGSEVLVSIFITFFSGMFQNFLRNNSTGVILQHCSPLPKLMAKYP